jgi:RimJ/RimL family protein N-acetyltransferase
VFRLETPRLILREMRSEDATELLRVFADPRVMASFGAPPFDAVRMDAWVRRNLSHQDEYGYGLFAVIHKGGCSWRLLGRGLATEAACAVRDLAFADLQLKRLVSLIRVGNVASRRVAEKVGMSLAEQVERNGIAYWLYAIDAMRR